MSGLIPRRSLVAVVAIVALLSAAAIVRAASEWTAGNAPLSAKPVDAQALATQLRDEQAHSAELRGRLEEVAIQAQQLADALRAAQDKAKADGATAAQLVAQLKAAQAKLATLQAQLAAAPATTVVQQPATAPAGEPEHEAGDD